MKLYTANEILEILEEGTWQYKDIKKWADKQLAENTTENLSVPAFHPMIDCIKY